MNKITYSFFVNPVSKIIPRIIINIPRYCINSKVSFNEIIPKKIDKIILIEVKSGTMRFALAFENAICVKTNVRTLKIKVKTAKIIVIVESGIAVILLAKV